MCLESRETPFDDDDDDDYEDDGDGDGDSRIEEWATSLYLSASTSGPGHYHSMMQYETKNGAYDDRLNQLPSNGTLQTTNGKACFSIYFRILCSETGAYVGFTTCIECLVAHNLRLNPALGISTVRFKSDSDDGFLNLAGFSV